MNFNEISGALPLVSGRCFAIGQSSLEKAPAVLANRAVLVLRLIVC